MILYRLFEVNNEFIEVIGLYQERDIAQKTISILPNKPYACTYGIDAVEVHSIEVLKRVMSPSEYIVPTAEPIHPI